MNPSKYKDRKPKERNAEQALSTLQWLCSKMERCESDARRSLYRWRVPREDWDKIIEKLVEDRFIDNERYAAAYTREKVSTSGWGKGKIIAGLRAKNIPEHIIEQVAEEYIKPEEMLEKLERLIVTKIEREKPRSKNDYDLRARVFRAAASRGYDFDAINELTNKYMKDED